jgi:hypothetical protein
MSILLNLTPEIEARLRFQSKLLGRPPEELAMKALEDQLASDAPAADARTPQQWIADFRHWAESHRQLQQEADDSRDSIYSGRGE